MTRAAQAGAGVPDDARVLRHVPGAWAVCQFAPDDARALAVVADLASRRLSLVSLTVTWDEISLVCPLTAVPADVRHEAPFSAFVVEGTLAFTVVGLLHALTAPLAAAGIPVFALSTYRTDYLLVPASRTADAAGAWRNAGTRVVDADMAPG